jgi:outer membrane lipoprotein SlyB
MKKIMSFLTITSLALAAAACGHNTTERAATGAIAGGVVAGPVGAAVGAGTGAVVSKAAGDK